MAEKTVLLDVQFDTKAAETRAANLRKELENLRKTNAELKKEVKDSGKATADQTKKLEANEKQIKKTNDSLRQSRKERDAGNNSIDAMRAKLSKLTKARNAQNTSTKKGEAGLKKYNKEIKTVTNSLKKQEQAGGDFRRSVGNYQKAMEGAAGSFRIYGVQTSTVTDTFKALPAAIGGTNKALKVFKIALIGTGIGAILVALGSLVAMFQSSEEGQNKWNKILKVTGVIIGNLVDILADLGEIIYDAIISPVETAQRVWDGFGEFMTDPLGKIVEGYESATTAAKDFIEELEREIEISKQLADIEATTDKAARVLLVQRVKLEAKIADLRLKAKQEDKFTNDQRLEFLEKASVIENTIAAAELALAKNRFKIIKETNELTKSGKEDKDAEAEAAATVERIEVQRLNAQRKLERERQTIKKEIEADRNTEQSKLESERQATLNSIEEVKQARQEAAQIEADLELKRQESLRTFNNEMSTYFDDLSASYTDQSLLDIIWGTDSELEAKLEKHRIISSEVDTLMKDSVLGTEQIDQVDAETNASAEKRLKKKAFLQNKGKEQVITGALEVASLSAALSAEGGKAQAAFMGAAAIADAWKGFSSTLGDSTLPFIAKIPAAFGLLAAGLKAAASVKAAFAGQYEDGGSIKGRSHKQGGVFLEAEGGEYIINNRSMAVPGAMEIANALNNLTLPKYANGGSVPLPNTSNIDALSSVRTEFIPVLYKEDIDTVNNAVAVIEDRSTLS